MDDDDIEANTILKGTYKIQKKKPEGKGSQGKVYLVENINTKEQYAVKFFEKDDGYGFKNEIKMLEIVSSLKSPYIINLIVSGEEKIKIGSDPLKNKKYIIIDYASKGDLHQYLEYNGKGLENKTAKLIFYKITKGLEAIHNSGICHRDIKMKNILMDKSFNPKICDFGLAAQIKGKFGPKKLYARVGTKKYAAPELLDKKKIKKPYDGIKVDIFSLGVVLINITVGGYGFECAEENDDYYNYIYNNKFNDYWKKTGYTWLDEDLMQLYLKMVSYNPENRPTIEEIFKSPWLKEITELNEKEFKELENKVFEEFQKIENMLIKKNEPVIIKETYNKNDGENRAISKTIKYFEEDLTPKVVEKTGLNMKHYMKIIGKVNPCILMNNIANEIKKKYEDKIEIIPSSYKLKFDVIFENMEDESDDEENQENEINEVDDENEEEVDENIENKIKNEKSVIQVKLFESLNEGYIVRFTNKKGEIIEYYKYLNEFRNIIKKIWEL